MNPTNVLSSLKMRKGSKHMVDLESTVMCSVFLQAYVPEFYCYDTVRL